MAVEWNPHTINKKTVESFYEKALTLKEERSKSTWFCNFWGWQSFDGCSKSGTCPRCGKAVLQDGQGNWF